MPLLNQAYSVLLLYLHPLDKRYTCVPSFSSSRTQALGVVERLARMEGAWRAHAEVVIFLAARLRSSSCKPLEPRQGEPRLPNKDCQGLSGLLGQIRAYWVALAPLALALMVYLTSKRDFVCTRRSKCTRKWDDDSTHCTYNYCRSLNNYQLYGPILLLV